MLKELIKIFGLGNYSRDLLENLIQDAPENQYVLLLLKIWKTPDLISYLNTEISVRLS